MTTWDLRGVVDLEDRQLLSLLHLFRMKARFKEGGVLYWSDMKMESGKYSRRFSVRPEGTVVDTVMRIAAAGGPRR